MSQETPYIFDATTADFEQSVIENSFHKPVLVDFWAEWCAPCKALMPMLQTIAESYQGELLLAKVNCDVEPDIVSRFGIRSLPTVVLFKDGQPVDGFAGAQPESAVRTMLEPHVQMPPPAAADPFEQAQALFDDNRFADAEATLTVLLGEDNTNAGALILYARCLTERGELGEAQTVLDAVKSDEHKAALAGAKAQIQFLGQAKDLPDAADLKARLAKNPQDDEAVYQLAIQQLGPPAVRCGAGCLAQAVHPQSQLQRRLAAQDVAAGVRTAGQRSPAGDHVSAQVVCCAVLRITDEPRHRSSPASRLLWELRCGDLRSCSSEEAVTSSINAA